MTAEITDLVTELRRAQVAMNQGFSSIAIGLYSNLGTEFSPKLKPTSKISEPIDTSELRSLFNGMYLALCDIPEQSTNAQWAYSMKLNYETLH